jgi:hypothetical protein
MCFLGHSDLNHPRRDNSLTQVTLLDRKFAAICNRRPTNNGPLASPSHTTATVFNPLTIQGIFFRATGELVDLTRARRSVTAYVPVLQRSAIMAKKRVNGCSEIRTKQGAAQVWDSRVQCEALI